MGNSGVPNKSPNIPAANPSGTPEKPKAVQSPEQSAAKAKELLITLRQKLETEKDETKHEQLLRIEVEKMTKLQLSAIRQHIETTTDVAEKQRELIKKATEEQIKKQQEGIQGVFKPARIGNELTELAEEVRQGDTKVLLKYGAVLAAGGFAAKWLWDHTGGWLLSKVIGSKSKPGFLRRALSLGAFAVGGLGAALVAKNWKLLPDSLQKPLDATKKGVENAWEKTLKPEIDAITNIVENGAVADLWKRRGEYANDTEFMRDLSIALVKDGFQLAWDGGVMHLMRSGKHLLINEFRLGSKLFEFMCDPNLDNGCEVWSVYIEGAVIYATSFGALEAILNMRKAGIVGGALKGGISSVTWPLQVATKSAKGVRVQRVCVWRLAC
jgi:hypothetical protein